MIQNERLHHIQTTFYQDASTTTLDDFIHHARREFEGRIISLYQLGNPPEDSKYTDNVTPKRIETCKNIGKALYSTAFYEFFWHAGVLMGETQMFPIYHFHVNPKNINFETTFTNLRELFDGMTIYPDEICMSPNPPMRYIKDVPNWEDIFGRGEFPSMKVYVFRLGNTEYFAYTIGK